ncbi:MAG: tetratricopeptide repeat protein [Candidatus Melainabacteria bacterium]|nr:tetratricopeptide repeat protein [Candidatus Melainabacteria bacterium]
MTLFISASFKPLPAVCRLGLLGLLCAGLLTTGWVQAATPEATRLYDQGIAAYTQGNSTDAIRFFQQATRADAQYSDAYFNLGSVYYQTHDYANAEQSFYKVLTLNPQDQQARYNLALTYEKLGKFPLAIEELKKIPSQDSKYTLAQRKLAVLTQQQAKTQPNKPLTPANTTASTNSGNKPTPPTAGGSPTSQKLSVETYASGFAGPTGMAMSGSGDMYVANYSKNLIYKVARNGQKTVLVEGGGLNGPIGLVLDPRSGQLYVANYLQNNIVRVAPNGQVNVLASGLNKPYNLLLDTLSNTLFVTEQGTHTVSRIRLAP